MMREGGAARANNRDAGRSASELAALLALISPPIFRQPYGVPSSRTSSKPPFTRAGKSVGSAIVSRDGSAFEDVGVGEGFGGPAGSGVGVGVGVGVAVGVGQAVGVAPGSREKPRLETSRAPVSPLTTTP